MAQRGVNKAIILGNLGKDPEVRHSPDGTAFCNFSVATSEVWKDKNTGQDKEQTEWHNITVAGRLAEVCGEYLSKGSKVYVEGRIRTRKWQDRETGADRYTTEIRADSVQFLSQRDGSGSSGYDRPAGHGGHPKVPPADEFFDDDIPFARPISPDGLCMPGDTGAWFGPNFSPWTLGVK